MTTITFNGTQYASPFSETFPPLTAEEETELRTDISARGVVVPVVVTEDNEVIDGHSRLKIATAIGLSEIPLTVVAGLTDAQKQQMAYDLNLHRRHLTRQKKQEIVTRKLKAEPARSNNSIAVELGVDDKTVGAARARMEATSEIPKSTRRRGRDGHVRRVAKRRSPIRPAAVPPASGQAREPYAWWPNLDGMSREAEKLAKQLQMLRKLGAGDRTLAGVRKIAEKLRQLGDRLHELLKSDNEGSESLRK